MMPAPSIAATGAALAAVLLTQGVFAQAPPGTEPLTLAQAAEQALVHYPGVSAVRFAADGASSAANGAAGARWPSFALTTTAARYQEPMLVTPIHGFSPELSPSFDRNLLQGAAALRYTIFDGLGREARIAVARAESDAAAVEVTSVSQALIARVSATYLGVLGVARVVEAQNRRIQALEAEQGRVRQLLDVGRAAEVDLMRVEAALAAARAEQVSLAAGLEVNEQQLSRLTGIPVDQTRASSLSAVTLQDTALVSRESLLVEALRANPAVLRERRRISAAEARTVVARSERWPQLDLAANYLAWASATDDPIVEWNVGVAVKWPVFTGGAVKNQIRRYDAELSAAGERLRLAESDVSDELDVALSSAREARARVASLGTAVARSEEVARIEQLRLDTGSGVQRDYLDAEAVLFANRAALVQARYNEILAHVTLARLTGQLDMEWVARNLGGTP